ncbi:MAG: glycoside hydrolase family 2 [Prevotellaceae bacterium]|jgi:hypothetical protein|nr:glycoside hydrolase family 2 [Prevotellaceae bacterium]
MTRSKKSYLPKNILFLLIVVCLTPNLNAQRLTKLWTGLRVPQPENELPKGNAPLQQTQRIPKTTPTTELQKVQQGEWIIANGWELTDGTTVVESEKSIFDLSLNTDRWYNATVPGTVLTTLVDQGVYPDPYFGLNNMAIPDTLCRMDWWYRITFYVPEDIDGKQVHLLFNGINYFAEVFLNGKKIGNIAGAFIRGNFNITDIVKPSIENVLAVHIYPPNNPGIPHEQSIVAGQGLNGGMLSLDGPTFISSIGWDWIPGIRDRNTGIWQDVRLKIGGNVVISDPLVITDLPLPDTTQAKITVRTNIKNVTAKPISGILTARVENILVEQPYVMEPYQEKELTFSPSEYSELNIKKPRLWYPNGYGKPELYDLTLEAKVNEQTSDVKNIRFGIRELSYELMVNTPDKGNLRIAYTPAETKSTEPIFNYIDRVQYTKSNALPTLYKNTDLSGLKELPADDPMGPYLVIRVNGKRIFCRGGNWGMDDGMKRMSGTRLEPYVKLHKEACFNIIRNWTGESTEEDFYALCDEYGILVWNDFWITTDDTVEPNDVNLFMQNARDVVRRYRNHPCIAIWCPRNEGFAPDDMAPLLAVMMAEEDPTRHYHGQSRFLNMDTSGPWGYFKDPSIYYTQLAKGFITEIGSFAIPTANTIRKFIAPQDEWPINDVWAYHDLHHTSQNFNDFMNAVNRYGEVVSMEDFSRKAQFVTYDAWRNIMEAWSSKMWNNTSGQILWMSHPAWYSMIWQTYTYDYETPGSYFGAKKACEPLHIQMNLPDNQIVVINTTLQDFKGLTAAIRYINLDGKELYKKTVKTDSDANSATTCFIPEWEQDLPSIYLARLELKNSKGKTVSINDYWMANDESSYQKINGLENVKLNINVKDGRDRLAVDVHNPSKTMAIAVKLNVTAKKSGEILLPAYFSDGYFNLLAGEKRTIELELPTTLLNADYNIIATGYNIE